GVVCSALVVMLVVQVVLSVFQALPEADFLRGLAGLAIWFMYLYALPLFLFGVVSYSLAQWSARGRRAQRRFLVLSAALLGLAAIVALLLALGAIPTAPSPEQVRPGAGLSELSGQPLAGQPCTQVMPHGTERLIDCPVGPDGEAQGPTSAH